MSICPFCHRRVPEVRPLTKNDHVVILKHNRNGWVRTSKGDLASRLKLTINQIAAVCAHTRPSLGGKRYVNKYLNTSTVRQLTDMDKRKILRHNASGWALISKADLAKALKCTVSQIAAICAWTRPSLGGKSYAKKYID